MRTHKNVFVCGMCFLYQMSPKLNNKKYDEAPPRGKTPEERRIYDRWYWNNIRAKPHESFKEKQDRYDRQRETYWINYCINNDLDPETWRDVREIVLAKKRAKIRLKTMKRFGYIT